MTIDRATSGHGPNQPPAQPSGAARLRALLSLSLEATTDQMLGDAAAEIERLRAKLAAPANALRPTIDKPSYEEPVRETPNKHQPQSKLKKEFVSA